MKSSMSKHSAIDRWKGIDKAWGLYKQEPAQPDSLVHFLIMLDSFITYASESQLDEVVTLCKEAIHLIELFNEVDIPQIDLADSIIKSIGDLINITTEPNYVKQRVVETDVIVHKAPLAVLLWSNNEEANEISAQMEHYGYDIFISNSPSNAAKTAIKKHASVVIIDVSDEKFDSINVSVSDLNKAEIPWIAVSDSGTFQERLDMVRLKVSNFLNKPVTASILVDAIDRCVKHNQEEPYRVMVVDDSPVLNHYIQQMLGVHGIETLVVSDVYQTLNSMNDFFPDLILLDVRMPSCSGLEVAQIIRQHEQFVSIPIVYLSSETNRFIQYEAIRLGGDEFLTKPISEEHLISTVTSKIERYRLLRRFMVQDSLTGLLNHTRIKQHLAQSVLLAKRDGSPLSFAMLDIDKFKNVNDTYGHPVGDRVIKSLAKVLRQRVRKSDVVGRYGGEEFAIVLHGAHLDDAYRIMDRIRKDFATIYHPYENGIFGATFSCGIAGIPMFDDPTIIAAKADEALYESKRNGRNQVTIFGRKPPKN